MSKKLSIITVCLNEVNTIEQTLQSVFQQTFKDYEYIVIDGGSEDGTLEILNKHKSKFEIFLSEKDNGIYSAMNKAIMLSKAEYLYFLNAGDYLNGPKILERIFEYKPTAELVYGDVIVQLNENLYFRRVTPGTIRKTYMAATTIPHQGSFTRKSLFDRIGGYDESYRIAADYDFFLKVFFKYKIVYQYIPLPWAVNQFYGTNSKLINLSIRRSEVDRARKDSLSTAFLNFFKIFSPIYAILIKYPSFIWFIIRSRFSKKFLGKENNQEFSYV
jgi:glycosyltransferase involved in cell wall biosynthesis